MYCHKVGLDEFVDKAGPWLQREPVLNNVLLNVSRAKRAGDVPVLGDESWVYVVDEDDDMVGAAMQTPPRGPYLSDMPLTATHALAEHFAAGPTLPGVGGVSGAAWGFATRYGDITGLSSRS